MIYFLSLMLFYKRNKAQNYLLKSLFYNFSDAKVMSKEKQND